MQVRCSWQQMLLFGILTAPMVFKSKSQSPISLSLEVASCIGTALLTPLFGFCIIG